MPIELATLRALEFDRVVQVVESLALTPLGAAALRELRPATELAVVRKALSLTTECVGYVETNGTFGLRAGEDLEEGLEALAMHGQPLDPGQLLGLAEYLASVDQVRVAVTQAEGGTFPGLRAIAERCQSFASEVAEIRRAIDPAGGVVDDASPELKAVRDRLRRQRSRLRGTLDSYLRGRDTAKYLQEQVVTERNGRFVLVVRAEHRSSIPGIVHGTSGSGASLFLEPLGTVDINNEIVALEQDERREVIRILLRLSDAFRTRAFDLRDTIAAATELDTVQARASFSRLVQGIAATLSDEPQLEWKRARHPLLVPAVRRRLGGSLQGAEVADPVPVDLEIAPPTTALVISGPNTGGKTVALKTAGLLSLMTQAGLHVPAGLGSCTGVFRSVFADIGDEQSIAASLSTFSGHIANLVAIHRQLQRPALVLLDELGAGTDPVEGGALAAAVTEHFRRRGAIVVVTTHDDTLKSYAATTPGVVCAGFGFDPDTYAPTYRLNYGSPGRSLALEIAARLGLPDSILDDARSRRTERESRLADHLARVERDLQRLEQDREALADERTSLDAERGRLAEARREAEQRETRLRDQVSTGVGQHVRAARQEIDAVVRTLRDRVAALEAAATTKARAGRVGLSTGETGALRKQAQAAVGEIADRAQASAQPRPPVPAARPRPRPRTDGAAPRVGDAVTVAPLGVNGQLVSIQGARAVVDVHGKRLHVAVSDLLGGASQPGTSPTGPASPGRVTVQAESADAPWSDLNVIGCTVVEACDRVEKHLDQALLQSRGTVRIIHGHGTGRLRRSIAGLLEEHPHVDRFEPASRSEGGEGATVVVLRD